MIGIVEWLIEQSILIHAGFGLSAFSLSLILSSLFFARQSKLLLFVEKWLSFMIVVCLLFSWIFGTILFLGSYQEVADVMIQGQHYPIADSSGWMKKRIFLILVPSSILLSVFVDDLTVTEAKQQHRKLSITYMFISVLLLLVDLLGVLISHAFRSTISPI